MSSSIFLFLIIIVNILVSYKGLTNSIFFQSYEFQVDRVLANKDYWQSNRLSDGVARAYAPSSGRSILTVSHSTPQACSSCSRWVST